MKIDFYIINTNETQADWLFACRLIEKAYELGHQIYVLCDDLQQAHAFDELLWQFNPDSFIPHHIQGEGPKPCPPVQIGFSKDTPGSRDILINLSANIPNYFKNFNRICEIVGQEEDKKRIKREHYKTYQGHQYKIDTHQVN